MFHMPMSSPMMTTMFGSLPGRRRWRRLLRLRRARRMTDADSARCRPTKRRAAQAEDRCRLQALALVRFELSSGFSGCFVPVHDDVPLL